jgi:hypothetical protein
MGLVDLRSRRGEPVPQQGIALGWEQDGEIVARVAVEREGDSLAIRSRAGDDVHAETLIDAVAGVATDASAIVDEDGRVVRMLAPVPAGAEEVAAITLADLDTAVRAAWSRETAEDPEVWSPDNPAIEHCGVTSLVVRELLGGEILVAGVVKDGRRVCRHAWNRLPSGLALDLTREQFRDGETFEAPVVGEPLVVDRYPERYRLFRQRVLDALNSRSIQRQITSTT